jgi:hypothetical protein
MKRLLLGAVLFVMVSFSARSASADYVCSTVAFPNSGGLGNYGYIYFTVYTGADCTGNWVGYYYLCSAGATSSGCAAWSSTWGPDLPWMMSMATAMRNAAGWNFPIQVTSTNCLNSSATNCAYYVNFN